MDAIKKANELIDNIYNSPTAFHAVGNVKEILNKNGYEKLEESEKWNLKTNGKYYITRNDSAIIAFNIGSQKPYESGFRIIGSHTDSPTFRIKPSSALTSESTYIKLNTEIYGGPILNTWFDRPLALAGRVTLRSDNKLFPRTKLVDINKPLMIIPNLAIHMNREVNKGIKIDPQKEMLPLIGMINKKFEKKKYILNLISEELNVANEEILDFDLFLYEYEKGCLVGENQEFISSARLDDLQAVFSGIDALISVEANKATNILACFDNEECGSSTKQGADSQLLSTILERIVTSTEGNREDFFRALNQSFIISADGAHAVHPNYTEKHDPTSRPIVNRGPVIKINANQSYTSDSNSIGVYAAICKENDIPVQKFVNKTGVRGGSTIGPISSTHVDIRSIDIGLPMLAMHSIRELCGVQDHYYAIKSFKSFYSI